MCNCGKYWKENMMNNFSCQWWYVLIGWLSVASITQRNPQIMKSVSRENVKLKMCMWKSSYVSLTVSCFPGVCSLFACDCVCCVVCFVCVNCEMCVSWVLSPALQSCDLWVQMRRPIDHKIGVPLRLWQPNCRRRMTSHYSPSLAPTPFFFSFGFSLSLLTLAACHLS